MKSISLINISFSYSGGDALFENLSGVFSDNNVVAIIGDNGTGKTTLLNIIAGNIEPDSGHISGNATTYLMQQITSPDNRSGGQKQWDEIERAFNSGANILLLDEPTNNLDGTARGRLFELIDNFDGGIVIVSHDRELLNRVNTLLELRGGKLHAFGGNYDFYAEMRRTMRENLESKYVDTTREVRRLNKTAQIATTTRDNHVAKQARDRANAKRSRLAGNALKGHSLETAARQLQIINKKLQTQMDARRDISNQLRDDKIKIPTPLRPMHKNDLIEICDMDFAYNTCAPLFQNFNLHMRGGARLRLSGDNGSGKTTLIRIILGQLTPTRGTIKLNGRAVYLDQNLTLLNPKQSIVENILNFGTADINSAHAIAANFGFRGDLSRHRVGTLSGGELLKATLAAILGGENQPDILILDEPTNNLDIKSTQILEDAINQYMGAVLIVSHDEMFIKNLRDIENLQLN